MCYKSKQKQKLQNFPTLSNKNYSLKKKHCGDGNDTKRPLDVAVTIEMLYGLSVHPAHLKAGLLRQVAGLHDRSRSVDVWQPQDMADLMNCHLK